MDRRGCTPPSLRSFLPKPGSDRFSFREILFGDGGAAGRGGKLDFLLNALLIPAIIGDAVGYSIGRKAGASAEPSDTRFFKKSLSSRRRSSTTSMRQDDRIARFIPLIRTFAPVVAGIAGSIQKIRTSTTWPAACLDRRQRSRDIFSPACPRYRQIPASGDRHRDLLSLLPPRIEFAKHFMPNGSRSRCNGVGRKCRAGSGERVQGSRRLKTCATKAPDRVNVGAEKQWPERSLGAIYFSDTGSPHSFRYVLGSHGQVFVTWSTIDVRAIIWALPCHPRSGQCR